MNAPNTTSYTPTFAELAGDVDSFLSGYFDTKPMLRRGALADRHQELLTFDDLDQMLSTGTIRPPYIRIFQNGQLVHDNAYTRLLQVQGEVITDCVDPAKVTRLLRDGATVTWNSLNHFRPNLRPLAAELAARFAARVDVMAFLARPHNQGFRPHADAVDLFVIQLTGTKHWRAWMPPRPHSADGVEYHTDDELGAPLIDTTLRPGDVLYLPYGTPHAVATEDTTSLHLSVMIRPRLWADLLNRVVQRLLRAEPEFARFPYLNQDNRPALTDGFQRHTKRLADLLMAIDPEEAVTGQLAWPGAAEGARTSTALSTYLRETDSPPGQAHT